MEVYYIEAGIFEEMLARADSLSAQADRLYEKQCGTEYRKQADEGMRKGNVIG